MSTEQQDASCETQLDKAREAWKRIQRNECFADWLLIGVVLREAQAAQLVLGEATLIKPTITQVVPVTHSSAPYVQLALRLKPETRARVATGELLLLDAVKANGLLAAWIASTPAERAALGVAVGADEIWDGAIEPACRA